MQMPTYLYGAWDIDETDFPKYGLPSARLAFMLRYAVLAPSSHNTQPWLFEIRGDHAFIFFDRTRALPVADPDNREAIMSCGAVLLNLRLAMRHFGYACDVQLLPDPQRPDLLACVRLGDEARHTESEERLFAVIVLRHTNRKPYTGRPVPAAVMLALESEAEEQGAWLQCVEEQSQREALASLVSDGDRVQWAGEEFRRELAAWMRPNVGDAHDGIPGRSMGYNAVMSAVAPAVVRTFDMGGSVAAHDRDLVEGSPLMVVLGTQGDSPYAWMEAGQALQAVLLRATAEGLSASFLNQPVEVSYLRTRLAFAIGRRDYPQVVLRLGYGPAVTPSPRRLPGEVLR